MLNVKKEALTFFFFLRFEITVITAFKMCL